ncbi:enoyl-CoA hydratase-related protein [Nocardioides humi]|uniref:1,4-dihydroxy-2-naphthoyl-CoA synthase n=1 Tax=Nocardioides humi TaxID=449461 RepID=A0ABN2BQZ4_9ACTN|nr:enoyl-CoA hydratase-related protein [Nocardioides humi]
MTDHNEELLYDVDRQVATITINRPRVLNAFTIQTLRDITALIERAGQDPAVRVIVLTGAGERSFCAGGDVSTENEALAEDETAFARVNKRLYEVYRECMKPIIARVNGYAIGGGNHLAYMADFTIAADHAVFGQNGPRVGSPAEGWIVAHLRSVIGIKRAKEIWMLCRRYTAQQALEWGLVNAVVPLADLDAEVRRWCDDMIDLSPTVLKLVKRSFDDSLLPVRERLDSVSLLQEVNPEFISSGEQAEGANAFMEKRKPDFSSWG